MTSNGIIEFYSNNRTDFSIVDVVEAVANPLPELRSALELFPATPRFYPQFRGHNT